MISDNTANRDREKWYGELKVLLAATDESQELGEVSVLVIFYSYF